MLSLTHVQKLILTFGLALVVFGAPAQAAVLWDNGTATGDSHVCDSTPANCGGAGGWVIYDNFTLSSGAKVTGFTYNSYFEIGATYSGTNWTLWSSDPFTAAGPVASGTVVAVLSSGAAGSTLFTATGLDISLAPGTYWLGTTNIADADTVTTRASANGNGLPGFKQTDQLPGGCCQFNRDGDTAFTIEGSTPEPATFSVLALGALLIGLKIRRRAA